MRKIHIAQKTKNELRFIHERDIRVYADRFQLKRVIKNLIQNAISYGKPKTPIEVTIGEIPDYVTIKIKDYGAGISREELDKKEKDVSCKLKVSNKINSLDTIHCVPTTPQTHKHIICQKFSYS